MAATSAVAAPTASDGELMLGLYRRMRLIRRFEEAVHSLFLKGEVHGTTHLYNGEEASATGVGSALVPGDRVAGTYRGHGHALSVGTSPQGLLDELLGRATGVCGGRAGSMNVIDLEHGLIGCFGIVGGSISAALGASLALRGSGNVAVAYFGDGATNQAYFHECLNFARVFSLPAIFVCENNLYGEFTPMEQVTAGQIRARAEALDIAYESVDGMDVWETRAAALRATERARAGRGPGLPRDAHLPLRRPLAQRSGPLPQAGRARALAGARSPPGRPAQADRRLRPRAARRWTPSMPRSRRR